MSKKKKKNAAKKCLWAFFQTIQFLKISEKMPFERCCRKCIGKQKFC